MPNLITFITIIAWVIGVVSTLFGLLSLYFLMTYTDTQRAIDSVTKGYIYNWKPMKPLILGLVCWSWIIAFAV